MRQLIPSFALGAAVVAAACGSPATTVTPVARGSSAPVAALPAMKSSGPIQVGDLLPDEQIQQVLNRLTFGGRPGDADRVRTLGIENWIDWQLHPEKIPDARTDELMSHYAVFNMKTADVVRDYTVAQQTVRKLQAQNAKDGDSTKKDARRDALQQDPQLAMVLRQNQQMLGEIASSKLATAVTTDRQLDEVM